MADQLEPHVPASPPRANPSIAEGEYLRARLLSYAQSWSRFESSNADWDAVRRAALESNHRFYLSAIPAYASLAESCGLDRNASAREIARELLVSDAVFKSYAPNWLAMAEFEKMTAWLCDIHSATPESLCCDDSLMDCANVQQWSSWLRGRGVHLSYSSGTSGRISFVPRDKRAFKALMENSRSYARNDWFLDAEGKPRQFACLVAGPRGEGLGILGAAAGLVRLSVRHHYFLNEQLVGLEKEETEQERSDSEQLNQVVDLSIAQEQEAAHKTIEFLSGCIEQQLPVLIFGPPFLLRRMYLAIRNVGGCAALPAGSMVSSGGGWKSFSNERISAAELRLLGQEVLGLEPCADASAQFVDAYSTAELNCTLMSCAKGNYHIPPLIEPVLVDSTWTGELDACGFGMIGFMDPFATSYPGFFVTGDIANLQRGRCDCGLDGWYLAGEIQRANPRDIKGCGGVLASMFA